VKILFNLQGAELGGGQRVASQVASGLTSRGHQVGVLAAREGPALEWFPSGTAFKALDLTTLRQPGSIAKAAGILRGYDVLYGHVAVGGQLAGAIACRISGRRQVVHQHNPVKFSNQASIRTLQKRLYPLLLAGSQFIAVAPHVQRDLVASGIHEDHVHVVVNGVEEMTTSAPRRSHRRLTVGMLSRFYPAKRIDLFIKAAGMIRSADVRFVVGGSPGGDSAYTDMLRRQAGEVGVEVMEPGNEAASFLDSLDIVCIPSEHEGLPLVLLEALALGKSVIASDIAAITDITEPAHAAVLVPVGDAEALAGAMGGLISNPSERNRMAEVGPKLIRSGYTLKQMVDASVRIIESCAPRGSARA
jgi:glycosyltransferase involved in cell wall biosynthesis